MSHTQSQALSVDMSKIESDNQSFSRNPSPGDVLQDPRLALPVRSQHPPRKRQQEESVTSQNLQPVPGGQTHGGIWVSGRYFNSSKD